MAITEASIRRFFKRRGDQVRNLIRKRTAAVLAPTPDPIELACATLKTLLRAAADTTVTALWVASLTRSTPSHHRNAPTTSVKMGKRQLDRRILLTS